VGTGGVHATKRRRKLIYKNSISRKSEVEKASEYNTDLFLKAHDKDDQLPISGLDLGSQA
jgi:hypothetical protein